MSKKLTGNGLWESSRMMLPQHKEQINKNLAAINNKTMPVIHDDELEVITNNIRFSLDYTEEVTVTIFEKNGVRSITGVVTSVSDFGKKLKIESAEGYEWIDFVEILAVQLEGSLSKYD